MSGAPSEADALRALIHEWTQRALDTDGRQAIERTAYAICAQGLSLALAARSEGAAERPDEARQTAHNGEIPDDDKGGECSGVGEGSIGGESRSRVGVVQERPGALADNSRSERSYAVRWSRGASGELLACSGLSDATLAHRLAAAVRLSGPITVHECALSDLPAATRERAHPEMLRTLESAERRLYALARAASSLDGEPIDWEAQAVHAALDLLRTGTPAAQPKMGALNAAIARKIDWYGDGLEFRESRKDLLGDIMTILSEGARDAEEENE